MRSEVMDFEQRFAMKSRNLEDLPDMVREVFLRKSGVELRRLWRALFQFSRIAQFNRQERKLKKHLSNLVAWSHGHKVG
jgi:hypothetical protein